MNTDEQSLLIQALKAKVSIHKSDGENNNNPVKLSSVEHGNDTNGSQQGLRNSQKLPHCGSTFTPPDDATTGLAKSVVEPEQTQQGLGLVDNVFRQNEGAYTVEELREKPSAHQPLQPSIPDLKQSNTASAGRPGNLHTLDHYKSDGRSSKDPVKKGESSSICTPSYTSTRVASKHRHITCL